MNEYLKANRAHWDELVAIHANSTFYDLEGFKAGKLSLKSLELEELGDVAGKSLLHLQCHFGMDTLSWARLGAEVTGVDFSDQAISLARSLSEELGIEASFVYSDIYELPDVLSGLFDIVYTSYGVLAWLPDLGRWAEVIAHFLKPGGTFYIAEIHPFASVFCDEEDVTDLSVSYPYFASAEPVRFEVEGSYADPAAKVAQSVTYEWFHPLAEVINSLTSVGLRIEFLHEFPYSSYQMFPFLERDDDGWWRLDPQYGSIPLTFSLKALK
ncbi:MAG: class I SAM-dependent methyltransferase [Anaerolineae bacterium]|jgi:SAM-dependent methyltransferase